MSLASTINAYATIVATTTEGAFPSVCTLSKMALVDGGATGDTLGTSTMATGVPCLHEPAGPNWQLVVGGRTFTASHRILLKRSAETLAITPSYRITIPATADRPALVFEEPIVIESAFDPFVTVMATLVQQGYRQ